MRCFLCADDTAYHIIIISIIVVTTDDTVRSFTGITSLVDCLICTSMFLHSADENKCNATRDIITSNSVITTAAK